MENEELELMLFRYREGLLSPAERQACEDYLASHAEARELALLYDPALRVEEQPVAFPHKRSLRRGAARIVPLAWRYAAAACVALAVAGAAYWALGGDQVPGGDPAPQMAQATLPQPPAASQRQGGEAATHAIGEKNEKEHAHYKDAARGGRVSLAPTPLAAQSATHPSVPAVAQVPPQQQEQPRHLVRYEETPRPLVAYQDDAASLPDAMEQGSALHEAQDTGLVRRVLSPLRRYGQEKWQQGARSIETAASGIGDVLLAAHDVTSTLWNAAIASTGLDKNR